MSRSTTFECAVDGTTAVDPTDWFTIGSAEGGVVDICRPQCLCDWAQALIDAPEAPPLPEPLP